MIKMPFWGKLSCFFLFVIMLIYCCEVHSWQKSPFKFRCWVWTVSMLCLPACLFLQWPQLLQQSLEVTGSGCTYQAPPEKIRAPMTSTAFEHKTSHPIFRCRHLNWFISDDFFKFRPSCQFSWGLYFATRCQIFSLMTGVFLREVWH